MARLITRKEAAQLLDVEQRTVSNWVNHGIIKGHIVDRHLKVDRDSIERYFDTLSDLAFMEKKIHTLKANLQTKDDELNDALADICSARELIGNGVPDHLFRSIFHAVMEVAGQEVLTEREATILELLVINGRSPTEIRRLYRLSRRHILEIADAAVRKMATMKTFADLRRDYKQAQRDNQRLKSNIDTLCNRLQETSENKVQKRLTGDDGRLYTLLCKPLSEMNLSIRVMNCFTNAEISTVGDLVRLSKRDLMNVKNFGKRCFVEVEDLVYSLGLSWQMDVDGIVSEAIQNRFY